MGYQPLSLAAVVRDIEAGHLSVEAALRSAAERIDVLDPEILAFVHRAPAPTLEAAHRTIGPLRGVAIGVKDIIDTAEMPTEHNSPIFAGHRPRVDASVVAMARAAGAAVLGKTRTTEFAYLQPTLTRNPHNPGHTPGGSSSGSAAAVAAGMVAAAFGTQTGGSVIRPASFCGIAGFKPSFRLLPTVGAKTFSWTLDTVGLFAATVEDVALFAALLTGRDLRLPQDTSPMPRLGLYRSRVDDRLDPDMAAAMEETARCLRAAGATVVEVAEPAALAEARDAHATIQNFEAAAALAFERLERASDLSPILRETLEAGARIDPAEYDAARRTARIGRRAAASLFETVDGLIAPSSLGAAPASLASTGDAVMNKLWTLTGNPVVGVPGCRASNGLPLGVSVIARFGRDQQALEMARYVEAAITRV